MHSPHSNFEIPNKTASLPDTSLWLFLQPNGQAMAELG